jgi:hypothetical protein
LHLDLVALAGLTDDAPALETFAVLGLDLQAKHEQQVRAPVTLNAD